MTSPQPPLDPPRSGLDVFIRTPDFSERHHRTVQAPADAVWAAATSVTPAEIRLLAPLMTLRSLPQVLTGRRRKSLRVDDASFLDVFEREGFVELHRDAGVTDGRALAIYGTVGRFWSPTRNSPAPLADARAFAQHEDAGTVKVAFSLEVVESGTSTLVTTETRIVGTDRAARRAFGRYWPRRAEGLPRGQRLLTVMPRFSDNPFLPPPRAPAEPALEITLEGDALARVTGEILDGLGPRDVTADFHCVTTWSVTGLVWRGVPLHEVLAAVGITEPPAPYVVARGADRCWTALVWEDLTAQDVLLATHLDGAPLDARHGAPLRLVAPSQYGYKSVKHLASLDFRREQPRAGAKQHLRARVALEERHPRLPAWAVRLPYRTLIGPTALLSERTLGRATARPGS